MNYDWATKRFRVLDASNIYSPLSYYLLYLTEKGLRAKASGALRNTFCWTRKTGVVLY